MNVYNNIYICICIYNYDFYLGRTFPQTTLIKHFFMYKKLDFVFTFLHIFLNSNFFAFSFSLMNETTN